MTAPAGLIRPTDAAAIRQARNLVAGARYGALAVLEAGTGHPGASRVAMFGTQRCSGSPRPSL